MKKSKIFLFIAGCLLFTLLLTSCERKFTEINLSEETKSYIMQPIGSWWVYEDSISGEIDSVVSIGSEISYERDEPDIKFEKLQIYFNSSINGKSINFIQYFWGPNHLLVNKPNLYIQGANLGYDTNNGDYIAFYPTYEMDGKIYKNVKVFGHGRSSCEEYSNWYWAKNIGLIKMIEFGYGRDFDWNTTDTINIVLKLKKYNINNK